MWQQIQRDVIFQNRHFGGYSLTNLQGLSDKDKTTDPNWGYTGEGVPIVNEGLRVDSGTIAGNPVQRLVVDRQWEEDISSGDYRNSRLTPYLYGTTTSNYQDRGVGDSLVSDSQQEIWLIEPEDLGYGHQRGRFLTKTPIYNIPVKINTDAKKSLNLYKKRCDKSSKRNDTSVCSTGRGTYSSNVQLPKHHYASNTMLKDKSHGINKRIPAIGGTISKNVFGTSGTYTLNCNLQRPTCADNSNKRKCIYEKGNGSGTGNERGFLNPQSRLQTPAVPTDGDNVSDTGSMLW